MRSLAGGKSSNSIEVFNINDIIIKIINLLNRQLEKGNIEILLNLSGESIPVKGNRTQMEQVLINLISNSIDALKNKKVKTPILQIISKLNNGNCLINFIDNGPGISEDIIDRIFDPFFTTKDFGEGMGLGLAITQNIIHGLEGSIAVENNQDGGACFTVALPAESG